MAEGGREEREGKEREGRDKSVNQSNPPLHNGIPFSPQWGFLLSIMGLPSLHNGLTNTRPMHYQTIIICTCMHVCPPNVATLSLILCIHVHAHSANWP